MSKKFNSLKPEQKEVLLNAPVLVCILIAGADDDIDKQEIAKAIAVTRANSGAKRSHLYSFYNDVIQDFEHKLAGTIALLPDDLKGRNEVIEKELKKVNDVFEVVDKPFAIVLYNSLKELALKVAKASGGFLGMNSVSEEEARFLSLSMIADPARMFR